MWDLTLETERFWMSSHLTRWPLYQHLLGPLLVLVLFVAPRQEGQEAEEAQHPRQTSRAGADLVTDGVLCGAKNSKGKKNISQLWFMMIKNGK